MIFQQPFPPEPRATTADLLSRSDPRGDARCEAPSGLPRQLRTPLDSSQQVPSGYVVRPLEVLGKLPTIFQSLSPNHKTAAAAPKSPAQPSLEPDNEESIITKISASEKTPCLH